MPLPNVLLKIEDFNRYNWQDVINESPKKDCRYYQGQLFKKAREARKSGDIIAETAFALLGVVSSFTFKLDSKETPLNSFMVFDGRRSTNPNDLNDERLTVLQQLVPHVFDAELQARIADVLWIRKGGHKIAECSIKSYLKSSEVLEQTGHWMPISERFERALQLALSLKNKRLIGEVVKHINSFLKRCDNDSNKIPTLQLMTIVWKHRKILKKYGQIGSEDYAALAERSAIRTENEGKLIAAQGYWSLAAAWYNTRNDGDKAHAAQIRVAEIYARQSEDALSKRTPPSYLVASHFLRQAIIAYRPVSGTDERVKALHKKLIDYGKRSLTEMHTFSVGVDIDQGVIDHAKECVKGKTIQDALFSLAFGARSPSVSDLRKEAQDIMKRHPHLFIFPRAALNDSGKVGKVAAGSKGGDGTIDEEAELRAEMFTNAQISQLLCVGSMIEPAQKQINQEHAVRLEDLYPLVTNNPFIPPGREYIFARGLYAGLTGDLLVCVHLLIPQLENSIRELIYQQGEVASTLEDGGIQQERNLNVILYRKYGDTLKGILGEDLLFDLKGLLVEEFGSNLRNKLAHGLMDANSFFSDRCLYLWWITLYLCCIFLLKMHNENDQKSS